MRVIGGVARGRPITIARSLPVRPTSDRVRESIFDVLASLGAIVGAEFLDLYAGSGALGIEAASRGAAAVTFVESDPAVVAAIEANLAATGVSATCRTRTVRAPVLSWLARSHGPVDVALCDPPYAFSEWGVLQEVLDAGIVVMESSRPVELAERYELHRVYRYGTTLVTVARRRFRAAQESAPASSAERER